MVQIVFTNNELSALATITRRAGGPLMQKLAGFLDDCGTLGGTRIVDVRLSGEQA